MDERIAQLTEEQRDVLRRFLRRQETKEIARELGITPSAVEQRFQRIRAKLGVARTIDAARLLADHDAASGRTPWGPPDLPPAADAAMIAPSPTGDGSSEPTGAWAAADVDEEDASTPARRARSGFRWPFPTRGRETNDLNAAARLMWMGFGLIGLLGVVAMLMNAIVALDTLLHPHR